MMKTVAVWWNRYIAWDEHAGRPPAKPPSKDDRIMAVVFAVYCIVLATMAVAAIKMFWIASRLIALHH